MSVSRRGALGIGAAVAVGVAGGTLGRCGSAREPSAGRSPTPAPARHADPLPAEIERGRPGRPEVALTFHGQGDPALARELLAELERHGARITVFAVGTWLAEQPAIARRILDGGHEVGNHTENHGDISQMTAAEAFREIDTCARRIRRLTGSIGTWFRPSQTQHANAVTRVQARRVGYPTCVSYDVDPLDYTDPGSPAVARATLGQVRPGSIVSLHFGHRDTLAAIGPILDGLAQRRLHAVTMTRLMA